MRLSNFAKNLKRLRLERRLTQVELAHRAGVTGGTVSRAEAGVLGQRKKTKKQLAKALGTTVTKMDKPPILSELSIKEESTVPSFALTKDDWGSVIAHRKKLVEGLAGDVITFLKRTEIESAIWTLEQVTRGAVALKELMEMRENLA